jgi:hypothetical protein
MRLEPSFTNISGQLVPGWVDLNGPETFIAWRGLRLSPEKPSLASGCWIVGSSYRIWESDAVIAMPITIEWHEAPLVLLLTEEDSMSPSVEIATYHDRSGIAFIWEKSTTQPVISIRQIALSHGIEIGQIEPRYRVNVVADVERSRVVESLVAHLGMND